MHPRMHLNVLILLCVGGVPDMSVQDAGSTQAGCASPWHPLSVTSHIWLGDVQIPVLPPTRVSQGPQRSAVRVVCLSSVLVVSASLCLALACTSP